MRVFLAAFIASTLLAWSVTAAAETTIRWSLNMSGSLPPHDQIQNPRLCGDHRLIIPTFSSVWIVDRNSGSVETTFAFPGLSTSAYAICSDSMIFFANNNSISAYSMFTFEHLWSNTTTKGMIELDYHNGRLYATTHHAPLLELEAATGRLLRTLGTEKAFWHSFFFAGNVYYVSSVSPPENPSVVCRNLDTGAEVWRYPCNGFELAPDGTLTLRQNKPGLQTIVRLDPHTGMPLWRSIGFNSVSNTFDFVTVPSIAGPAQIFIGGSTVNDAYPNYLVRLDRDTGKPMWNTTFGFYYLLAGDDAVLAGGTVTGYTAYSAVDGAEMWQMKTLICANTGIVANNTVFFGTVDHSFFALQIRR